jgi:urease subunit beta
VKPGEIRLGSGEIELAVGRERRHLMVENRSRRVVRVSSHYPFERVNPRLAFDRETARGFRLDIPAGETARWAPGEVRVVGLVRFGGRLGGTVTGAAEPGEAADEAPDRRVRSGD